MLVAPAGPRGPFVLMRMAAYTKNQKLLDMRHSVIVNYNSIRHAEFICSYRRQRITLAREQIRNELSEENKHEITSFCAVHCFDVCFDVALRRGFRAVRRTRTQGRRQSRADVRRTKVFRLHKNSGWCLDCKADPRPADARPRRQGARGDLDARDFPRKRARARNVRSGSA